MLQLIRSKVTSIFIKVLFAVLIMSFAIWGIGDIFLGSPDGRSAITVGEISYNSAEVLNRFDRVRRSMRLPPSASEDLQPRILDDVIQSMVEEGLIEAASRELNLLVSDDQLMEWVAVSPTFRNQAGAFDPDRFRTALFNAGMSEATFFDALRQDLKQRQITAAVSASVSPSDSLIDAIHAYRTERRIANLISIRFESVPRPPEPSDSDLRAHYEANRDGYMAPEYRRLLLVTLTPQEMAKEILISDDELRDSYESRIDEFRTPATRDLVQFLFPDEAAAKSARDALTAPLEVAGIEAKLSQAAGDGGTIVLGWVAEPEITDEKERKTAFGTPSGEASDAVETPFGWKVFLVKAVTPEAIRSFDEVRPEIANDLALERADDALFELANAIEDSLAGGATIGEAARAIDITPRRIGSIDRTGLDRDGNPVTGLPGGQHFLQTVFSTGLDEQSDLVEIENGGYFIVRVDGVENSTLRLFEDVREDVRIAWTAERRMAIATERAVELAEKSKGGTGLKRAARALGHSVTRIGPFDRFGSGLDATLKDGDLAAIAFDLAPGDVEVAESGTASSVVELVEVVGAETAEDAAMRDQIARELTDATATDYLSGYIAALKREYAVTIDRGYIDTLMAQGQ